MDQCFDHAVVHTYLAIIVHNSILFISGWIVKVKIDDASIDDLKDLLDEKAYEEVKSNASDD